MSTNTLVAEKPELSPEQLADQEVRRKEAEGLGIPTEPVPTRYAICTAAGLIDRARELGHPHPAKATSDQIALLGNLIQNLARKLDHPHSGRVTREELAHMIGMPNILETQPSVDWSSNGMGSFGWVVTDPALEKGVEAYLASQAKG